MGYRSQVVISVYEPGYIKLCEACKEHELMPSHIYKGVTYDGDQYFTLVWDYVKWYSLYEEVIAIENVLDELRDCHNESEDDSYSWNFMRTGEDVTDVEERYAGEWFTDACVCTYIDIENVGQELE